MCHRRAEVAKYPVVGAPRADDASSDWMITVERAPGDTVTKRFANRAEAREVAKAWRIAAKVLLPRKRLVAGAPIQVTVPRTKKDLIEFLSRTIAHSQAGEIQGSAVGPIIQLAKMQLKLMDMKDPEEDLTGLTETQLLDKIFEQLTTEELLALARERLDVREDTLAA